jgi:hypothetical protein
MSQYLVAIHLPDNFDPSAADDAAMGRDIDTLNEEIVAAGGRIFLDGFTPGREAKTLRAQSDGKLLTPDGPDLETEEPLGGSWVLEVAGLDEALAWGRKAVLACRASVEVRPLGVPA